VTESTASGGDPWGQHSPSPLPSRRDFDTTVAHPARVWDYWLGGKDNFAADRHAGDQVIEAMPSVDRAARAGRAFLAAAVHYLAAGMGVRQFLDIGTGLPTSNNTHEVAQRVGPESRIVYVDNDPIVLTHARALLTSDARGATAYIDADLRDTGKILAEAGNVLDFSQPIALMLLHILHFIPDRDDPWGIVAELLAPMPPGSYLVVSHASSDIHADGLSDATERYNRSSAVSIHGRSQAEVTRFFDGLDLVEPGVVPLGQWQPGPLGDSPRRGLPTYTAVGLKP
jgi:S-adenosyl methyltransferase